MEWCRWKSNPWRGDRNCTSWNRICSCNPPESGENYPASHGHGRRIWCYTTTTSALYLASTEGRRRRRSIQLGITMAWMQPGRSPAKSPPAREPAARDRCCCSLAEPKPSLALATAWRRPTSSLLTATEEHQESRGTGDLTNHTQNGRSAAFLSGHLPTLQFRPPWTKTRGEEGISKPEI
jgi:hypothetical protein